MVRALALAAICAAVLVRPGLAVDRQIVRLTIKVVLVDAAGVATPVSRHPLLISDNPPSAAPQRVVTGADGTAGVNLRPGSYLVESGEAVAFEGQAYRWVQTVDVAADRSGTLELTAANAIVEPVTEDTTGVVAEEPDASVDNTPSALLRRWQDSVVEVWSPTGHGSGFVIDARGLIATNQRVVGGASSVEVQFTPQMKVAGRVVAADAKADVAIIRVAPSTVASITPLPLPCASPAMPLVDEQDVIAMGIPLRGARGMAYGTVRRLIGLLVVADFNLRRISLGGPVFDDDGQLVGISSIGNPADERLFGDSPIVGMDHACPVAAAATAAMADSAPPNAAHLPVEPDVEVATEVLEAAADERADDLEPYTMSSSDFDIAFITPVLAYAGLERGARPTMDFSNWSDYVRGFPPVLFIRVTPKQSESFWMRVVRGAAMTQGASLPPITSFKSGFLRLRAFCGETEVTPVHPFQLELRVSETEAVHEGLYVFEPDALGPGCGSVRLTLYSEKDPEKADTREVDPAVIERIARDFLTIPHR